MSITTKVNDKSTIKTIPPTYFHCFKLTSSSYALFDMKMDMPIIIGSLAIIKTVKLPQNSMVFYYEINSKNFFEKGPKKTIAIKGNGKHSKPPLRYHYVNKTGKFYHYFKLTPVLSVLFDTDFSMPIVYGSNQKIQATMNHLTKEVSIFYYKEDFTIKNSFKFFMMFEGNASVT